MQIDGLDELKETLNEDYERCVKELSSNIEKMTEVMNDAITKTAENASGVLNTMSKILKALGVDLTLDQIGLDGAYAKGTKSVPKDGLYLTQENGPEIISTSKGLITPLSKGDGVIPNDMTERLFEFAKNNPIQHVPFPVMHMPEMQNINNQEHIECNIGDIVLKGDNSALTKRDLEKFQKSIVEGTIREIIKDARKGGIKRKF